MTALMGIPKKIKKNITNWLKDKSFTKDYEHFLLKGKTTDEAYQKLIQLYCASNGKFTDRWHQYISKNSAKEDKLKPITDSEKKRINNELNQEGYAIYNRKLSSQECDQLNEFALNVECIIPGAANKGKYDPANPISPIYRIPIADLMNQPLVQKLIMDPDLIDIARNYLGTEPIFDFPAMWWSTSFSKEASDEAAQLYHFDMDRIKWLKLFIYLSDVTDENGPHCYIAKSHQTNSKPQHILDRGYVRVPDNDLIPFYEAEDFKKIKAKCGTIFFGDTKCWHKGQPLKKGARLVLEFQYTASLFGVNNDIKCSNPTPEFKAFAKTHNAYMAGVTFVNNENVVSA